MACLLLALIFSHGFLLPRGEFDPGVHRCDGVLGRGAHVFQLVQRAVYGPPVAEVWEVDCEGFMASIAHNVLKVVRSLGHGIGPTGSEGPDD